MNNKKIILILITLIIVIVSAIIISKKIFANNTNTDEFTIKEEKVSSQTIIRALTSSAEISSGLTEKIELHATYYFEELLVEKNAYVEEGTKILKYTNGTYLIAPYDCVITGYSLPEAEAICKNSHYVEIQTTETLSISVSISESEMENVPLGKEVELVINAFPDVTYTGIITSIDESGTYSQNGTSFSAVVTFMNDGNIKLGMSSSCTIILQKEENVVAVPVEAIEVKDNTKYVIVVNNDGTTKEVTVETGISNANYVEIKSGLSLGETVQYKSIVTGDIKTTN